MQSYLIGKGTRFTNMTTDLDGIAFFNVPTVETYEYWAARSNAPAYFVEIGKIINNLLFY